MDVGLPDAPQAGLETISATLYMPQHLAQARTNKLNERRVRQEDPAPQAPPDQHSGMIISDIWFVLS